MYRELQIGGHDAPLCLLANAATAYRYRQVFGEDLIALYAGLAESKNAKADTIDAAHKLAFVMNAAAEKKDMARLNAEAFYAWLEQYDELDLATAADSIWAVFLSQQEGKSRPKSPAD